MAGGVASYAGPGSPFNKVSGLGFGGVPAAVDIERVQRAYAALAAASSTSASVIRAAAVPALAE